MQFGKCKTEIQGHEVNVLQFRVDFKSDSGTLGLYLQHIFKNQPWLLWESGETARNLHAHRSIMPFINGFTYTEIIQTPLT